MSVLKCAKRVVNYDGEAKNPDTERLNAELITYCGRHCLMNCRFDELLAEIEGKVAPIVAIVVLWELVEEDTKGFFN